MTLPMVDVAVKFLLAYIAFLRFSTFSKSVILQSLTKKVNVFKLLSFSKKKKLGSCFHHPGNNWKGPQTEKYLYSYGGHNTLSNWYQHFLDTVFIHGACSHCGQYMHHHIKILSSLFLDKMQNVMYTVSPTYPIQNMYSNSLSLCKASCFVMHS